MNYLIKGDNTKIIKKLIENDIKADLVLTDPPYNVSRKHQLGFSNMGRKGMNYGEWDYNFDQLKWLENIDEIINKNGSIIIFNDWKNMGMIATFLESKGFIIKDLLRWDKTNPMPRNTNRRYASDAEYALWAVKKGSKWIFNKPSEKPYLRTLIKNSIMAGSSKSKIHPTQKPIKLLEEIISVHTNKDSLIIDPFSGSGSTGHAAEKLGRKFILIEKNKEFYEKSKEKFDQISTTL